jgi:hypothetical protein
MRWRALAPHRSGGIGNGFERLAERVRASNGLKLRRVRVGIRKWFDVVELAEIKM